MKRTTAGAFGPPTRTRAHALARRYPELRRGLRRAADLVEWRRVEYLAPGWRVERPRPSRRAAYYLVLDGCCECAGAARAPRGWCVHRLAVLLIEAETESQYAPACSSVRAHVTAVVSGRRPRWEAWGPPCQAVL
jgi:hypothetical protein